MNDRQLQLVRVVVALMCLPGCPAKKVAGRLPPPSGTSSSSATPASDREDARTEKGARGPLQKPHIVVIVADDMGWNDVGFHGSNQIPTPNIDALAYNGVILNSHYVSAMCTPSRASLMTGKYPTHLGMQHSVLLPAEPRGLPLDEKLLPQYLREAGYRTHAVGKWHLGYFKREYTPTYRGFDSHFGYWNGLQDYYSHVVQEMGADYPGFVGFDMRRNLTVAWETKGKYSTDLFTEEAVRLIDSHDTRDPMFLYLAHMAPHTGNEYDLLQAPDEAVAKFSYINDPERRVYAAMVSKLDDSVGEVVSALRNRGMLENSVIVFISDNGAPTSGVFANRGSNYPLRGIKNSPWEGGVRGVAAVWSTLIETNKRVSDRMFHASDWLPTLLSAAGIDNQQLAGGGIDGVDLWPTLVYDRASPRTEIVHNIDDVDNYSAIRRGDFKYVIGMTETGSRWEGETGRAEEQHEEGTSPLYDPRTVLRSKAGVAIAAVVTANQISQLNARRKRSGTDADVPARRFKQTILTASELLELRGKAVVECNANDERKVACDPIRAPCLFDIANDPCETINLADARPVIVTAMEAALVKYRLSMVPAANLAEDPLAEPAYWNGTWTTWKDRYSPEASTRDSTSRAADRPCERHSAGPTVAGVAVILAISLAGAIALFAIKCRNNGRAAEQRNGGESIFDSANDRSLAVAPAFDVVRGADKRTATFGELARGLD